MEKYHTILIDTYNDHFMGANFKKYGFSSQKELKEAVEYLGDINYVESNTRTQTKDGKVKFGALGESMDIYITDAGKAYLKHHGLI